MQIFVAFIVIVLLGALWLWWQTTTLTTRQVEINALSLPEAFDGFRIVHISDLHNQRHGREQSRLIARVRDAEPDIIVITGDMKNRNEAWNNTMDFIRAAVEIAPIYFVTGNHEEASVYRDEFLYDLQTAGVNILNNEYVRVERDGQTLPIFGIRDRDFRYMRPETWPTFEDEFSILLAHRPHYFRTYAERGFSLVFTGHAHGGQVRIPLIGGVFAPGQSFFPGLTRGPYHREDSIMIVSRGLGGRLPVPRVFNRPEVVVVTLKSA